MLKIKAIAEEFWRGRGSHDDTWSEVGLNNIKSENESLTKVGAKTVVWWRDEGEEVDEWERLGAGDRAVGVGDWECEEDFVGHDCAGIGNERE